MSIGTLSLLYSVRELTKFLLHTLCILSFSSLQSLYTQSSQSALFSLINTLAYKICRIKAHARSDVSPSTISTSFIRWLRSLRLHFYGPKAPHPQNLLQYIPKPLQNGVKPLLVFNLCALVTVLHLVSFATSPKILRHVLKIAQLPRSCFPAPTGPQHSLVAHP